MYQKMSCISWPVPAISFHADSGPNSMTGAKKNSREERNSMVKRSTSTCASRRRAERSHSSHSAAPG